MDRYDRRNDPARAGRTLPEILDLRAREQGDQNAYILLGGDESERERLSYAELAARSRGIAAELVARGLGGRTAVLLYPNDLDFVCAFLGCLYASVLPVPCYPPSGADKIARFSAIAHDSGAAVGLCSAALRSLVPALDAALAPAPFEWIDTSELAPASELPCALPDPAALAFLQYTSGSTALPKGVMVSHDNLLANAAAITSLGAHPLRAPSVSWLPLYHDMGLIGGVVTALCSNVPVVLMSPLDFLKRPLLWLRAISRYRAATSGAPNFAYELCATRIATRHCDDLDLGCWLNAFNGAEPIRAGTLERFSAKFARFGFRPASFFTCYGLAEATLLVSAVPTAEQPRVSSFERVALEAGRALPVAHDLPQARPLVSCGARAPDHRVEIADPGTCEALPQGRVGEIWVAGPSVARGYWGRPDATRETFGAELRGEPGTPFLRTGDLGFFADGELFVTGRAKDLLIVRGRNFYPQDLEQCAQQASDELRADGCAAFAADVDGEERPVLVCELQRAADLAAQQELAALLRSRVASELDIALHAVVLVRPGAVPRTSSGKVRRSDCRRMWSDGALPVLFDDAPDSVADPAGDPATALLREMLRASDAPRRALLLEPYVRVRAAALAGVAPAQVRLERSLPEAGLDSLRMLELKHELDALLDAELPLRALVEAPSLSALAAAAAALEPGAAPAPPGSAAPVVDDGALSHGQAAVWFVQTRHPDTPVYNVHLALRVKGPLDRVLLQRAIDALVERHPILRTAVEVRDGRPHQVLRAERRIEVEAVDASDFGERRWRDEPARLAARPFDLERGEVARVHAISRSANEHVLALAVHHIAVDFWSIVTLVHELRSLFSALRTGTRPALPPLARSYGDFVRWQQQYLEAHGADDARYWREQLGGELQRLELPLDRPRPAVPSFHGASVPLGIDAATRDALRGLGRSRGATLYMTLLAGFSALLHRYSGQSDIVVGTPLAGRPDPSYAGVVGYFTNPVALRTRPARTLAFGALIDQVRGAVAGALEHQHYPFSRVVEELRPARDADLWPLYQVAFTLQTPHISGESELAALALGEAQGAMDWGGLPVEAAGVEERVEAFDLKLVMAESANGLLASFQYNADLFGAATVERMARHFGALLADAARHPDAPLGGLELLDASERADALHGWNRTRRTFAGSRRLEERFEQIARTLPGAIALVEPLRSWTYAQLNARANQIARALRARGVGEETRVLPLLGRSADLVAVQLAILKVGGAFVPVDTDAPAARLAHIADQTTAGCIIARRPPAGALAALPVLALEHDAAEIELQSTTDLLLRGSPEALACVVFTSGSTGRPHGAMNTHAGFVNLCDWHYRQYHVAPGSRTTWLARLSFDASLWELWPYLLAGATVHLPPDDELRADPAALLRWLAEQQIDVAFLATPIAERVLREPRPERLALRALFIGGDRLGRCPDEAPPFRVVNHYGPSEFSVVATAGDVPFGSDHLPPIGAPIANTQAYVLDAGMQPVPLGVVGELYLGGRGLARGYDREPGLSAERFLPDPFGSEPGARLYRTGDRVRRTPDGNLDFIGRTDHQVKLRGNRIELGEIESVLSTLPGVDVCAVVLRDDPPRLVAYVHGEAPHELADAELPGQHVDDWARVYDDTYAAAPSDVPGDFDVTGWNSSYTGAPLSEAEMREWVGQTVAAIGALEPRHVVEIGVGTGLLMQRLAPHCASYRGSDFSRVAIETLRQRITGEPWAAQVSLECRAAHEPLPPGGPADVVVLNSVAQYFPSLAYLHAVLARALEQVGSGGSLFIGDLRVLPWLDAFLADLALEQIAPSASLEQLGSRVAEQRARLRELLVDPRALAAWLATRSGVTHTEVRLKPGSHANELNRFRCDVVAHVRGVAPEQVQATAWTPGMETAELLALRTNAPLAVTGIPNARLTRPERILAALHSGERGSAGELRRTLANDAPAGVEPAELLALAHERGLRAELRMSSADAATFDVVLAPADHAGPLAILTSAPTVPSAAREPDAERGAAPAAAPAASDPLRERLRRAWQPELRRRLGEALPEYMLPAQILLLEHWPRTVTGKTDRRALPAPGGQEWRAEFAAPRSAREIALAEIWCALLGLDRVGIHDGFFELGGDSILSIQLVHRARQRGLHFQPRHVFEHSTIARLAAAARESAPTTAPQEPFTGAVPWTPVTAWWRDLALPDPSHWNQSVLLDVPRELELTALRSALAAVVAHHDTLRLRLRRGALEIDPGEDADLLDEAELDKPCGAKAIAAHCARVQQQLDLERGPVFRALHLRCPELRADRLLLVAHHLAVDAVSWRILAEDLSRAYVQALIGQPASLPLRTTPFAHWAARLHERARVPELAREREIWRHQLRALAPLPVDFVDGAATEGTRDDVRVELSADATHVLLHEAHAAYRTRVDELLLAALARAVARWAGTRAICVDYESHGREELFEGVDLSRTVGWFTAQHPLALACSGDLEADLCHAKEALRSLPHGGVGYGLLRHLAPGRDELDLPRELAFNYLGRIDTGLEVAGGFGLAREDAGPACSPRGERPYLIDVNAAVRGGALELRFAFSRARHRRETLEALARDTLSELHALLGWCTRPGAGRFTPSDFPLAALGTTELARLRERYPRLADVYPLTPLQEGLWLHGRLAGDPSMYVVQLGFEIHGPLDLAAFERAWQRAVARHDVLRSAVIEGPDGPLQVVNSEVDARLDVLDWRGGDAPDARLTAWLEQDRSRGFELEHAPLARLALVRLADQRARLVFTHHHLILDGWSIPVLLHEVLRGYEADCRGAPLELPPAPAFRTHVEQLARQDPAQHEAFWREQLAGHEPEPLFGALPRTGASGHARVSRVLGPELTAALEQRARQWGLTPHTLMQGAFALVLAHCSGRSDVVFGSVTAGRTDGAAELEHAVGLFIQTLPVRARMRGSRRLRAWLQDLQETHLALTEHAATPLARIERWAGASPREPLFDALFAFENYPIEPALRGAARDLGLRGYAYWDRTHYALTWVVSPAAGERRLEVAYDTARFEAAQIEQMIDQFAHVLACLTGEPDRSIGALDTLTPHSRRELAGRLRPRAAALGAPCVVERFAAQVAARPDAPAVRAGNETWSYAELERRASRLAALLRERGLGCEDRVVACLSRNTWNVAAFTGVLRAGAVYVPLDPEQPDARLAFAVRDAGARIALVDATTRGRLPADLPCLELDDALLAVAPGAAPELAVHPEQLAYVIYTSGSTGTPKGVAVSRRALARLFEACASSFDFAPSDRWSMLHSAAFDFSVWEIWGALTTGGCVVVVPDAVRRDSAAARALLAEERISVLSQTPAAFDGLLAALEGGGSLPAVRWIVFGGDELHPDRLRPWFERHAAQARLVNMYGITETTVHVTWHELDPADLRPPPSPIGEPLADLAVHLLGRDGRPVPPGWVGEIHVAGAGLARGYLDRPALTAERFVPDPLSHEPGARVYRSGDLARAVQGAGLQYLGRGDSQIQLRGYRIELGEIEAELETQLGVQRAAVALRGTRLVGYVVAEPGTDLEALRGALESALPAYMLPQKLVALAALPLTPNGKLDRRALPDPELEAHDTTAPRNDLEARLHALWRELLAVREIGVHDDFFQLGGDSILAVQLASRAHRQGIQIRPRQIFEQPTIAALARVALDARPVQAEQGRVTGEVPLTPIQSWWAAQALPQPEHWNQSLLFDVRVPLDLACLRDALDALVTHHDALRLVRRADGSLWNAETAPQVHVHTAELGGVSEPELAATIEAECAQVQRGLALEHGPLIAAAYLDLGPDRGARLLLCAHHLAVDGVSWRLLLEDLEVAYAQRVTGRAIELPPKTTSYRAWALRVAERAQSEPVDAALEHWSALPWAGTRPLPRDFAGGPNLESTVDTVEVALDPAATRALVQGVAQGFAARPDDLMLTALAQVLCGWAGGSAAALVLEGHGREELFDDVDVSRTVGWFTSLYPLALELAGGSPLDDLKRVKEQLRRVPERGRVYGRLRFAGPDAARAELAALPAPEISFNHLGQLDSAFAPDSPLAPAPESSGPARAPAAPRAHLIDVTARVQDRVLRIAWTYSQSCHGRPTVQRLAELHLERLRTLIEVCTGGAESALTPSDFPLAPSLDQAALDRLLARARTK